MPPDNPPMKIAVKLVCTNHQGHCQDPAPVSVEVTSGQTVLGYCTFDDIEFSATVEVRHE